MRIIGNQGMKFLKALHLLFAFLWVGGAISMMLLVFFVRPHEEYGMLSYASSLKMIDDRMIIVGAMGCLVTGLLYGIITKWGFFKYRWLAVKWILVLFMMISGTYAMGPCIDGNVFPVEDISRYSMEENIFFKKIMLPLYSEELFDSNEPQNIEIRTAAKSLP